MYEKKRKKK